MCQKGLCPVCISGQLVARECSRPTFTQCGTDFTPGFALLLKYGPHTLALARSYIVRPTEKEGREEGERSGLSRGH